MARHRGRAGDELGARRWLELARTFAAVDDRRRATVETAILAGRRGLVHAGQLRLDGSEVTEAELAGAAA